MLINDKELSQLVRTKGAKAASEHLVESLQKGDLTPNDFSLKALAKHLICDSAGRSAGEELISCELQEGMAETISTQDFSKTNYQIFYNAYLEGYKYAELGVADLFKVVTSNNLGVKEKFAGVGDKGNVLQTVPQGKPIPKASFQEDYINAPQQVKKAIIFEATREAYVADKTGELLEQMRSLGEEARLSREYEAVDTIINNGGATDAVPYMWRDATYGVWQTDNTVLPSYANVVSSNNLVTGQLDAVNNAYTTLAAITSPFTGQPILDVGDWQLLHTPTLKFTVDRIARATEYRTTPAVTDYSPAMVTNGQSVVPFRPITSKILNAELLRLGQANTNWYIGNFSKSFAWVRSLEPAFQEAVQGTGDLFRNDLIAAFRIMKQETACVWNPRYVCKNTA